MSSEFRISNFECCVHHRLRASSFEIRASVPPLSFEIRISDPFALHALLFNLSGLVMRIFPFLLLLFATPALADLSWETQEQTFHAKASEKQVVAKYRFTNTGTAPVKIENVKTSCGCTTAGLKKTEYAPGESGEIEAKFDFGGRTGKQEKGIAVSISDEPLPTILRLLVDIEEPVKLQPQFVIWKVGDKPNAQIIRLTVADDVPAKVLSVESDNPMIKAELTPSQNGKSYEVQVTPSDTVRPAAATLIIRTDYPADNPQVRYAYARIK